MRRVDEDARLGRHVRPLSEDECWVRLAGTPLGRVAFIDGDGHPTVLPVNHAVDDRTVVFRSVPGSKLAVAAQQQPVSFEVDDFDAEAQTGWSVVAKGRADLVANDDEIVELFGTSQTPWGPKATHGTVWVRLEIDQVTGLELGMVEAEA